MEPAASEEHYSDIPSDALYDYANDGSHYDEEGASSYYSTIERAAARLALGLGSSYTDHETGPDLTDDMAGSVASEYSEVAEAVDDNDSSSSSSETEESDENDPPSSKRTQATQRQKKVAKFRILADAPASVKALRRSAGSSSSDSSTYDDIYGQTHSPAQHPRSVDPSILPLPRTQLRSIDLRVLEPFDKFYWSEQFFKIHEEYLQRLGSQAAIGEDPELLDIYFRLSAHAQDFVSMAEKYAKIIISEKYLPYERKTVKPSKDMGGIAGGDKYVCQGILMKFALDKRSIYGSDDNAIKSAGHDLNGLTLYYQCNILGLYVPLMCAVDYKGYRVLCLSVLNISSSTLKYGSADGGKTVRTDNDSLNGKMKSAAAVLNLAKHVAGAPGNTREVYSAADLEGHVVSKDRAILLDFARVMPPEPPTMRNRSSIFYRMLRPELVRQSPVPLSSDSFSRFQQQDPSRNQLNQHCAAAWRNLTEVIIPRFAEGLKKREAEMDIQQAQSRQKQAANLGTSRTFGQTNGFSAGVSSASVELVTEMHAAGINLRYLGYVRRYLSNGSKFWKSVASVEMIARVVKRSLSQILRKAMRELMMPSEELYRRAAVEFLNIVLGNGPNSQQYWRNQLPQSMHLIYCYLIYESCEDQAEHEELKLFINCPACGGFNFAHEIDRSVLFARLATLLPLEFSKSCLRELSTESAFQEECPLEDTDVVALTARVKNIPIIDKGKAFMLYRQAKQSTRSDVARALLESAIEKFNVSLQKLPDNLTFHCAANSLQLLAKLCSNPKDATALLKRSFEMYRHVSAGFRNNTKCWGDAIDELERQMLANPTEEMQNLYATEMRSYLILGHGRNPESVETWIEAADMLASASARLAQGSGQADMDSLFPQALAEYTKAIKFSHKSGEPPHHVGNGTSSSSSNHGSPTAETHASAAWKMGTHLVQRAILLLSHSSDPQSKQRYKILTRFAKEAFRYCMASDPRVGSVAHDVRKNWMQVTSEVIATIEPPSPAAFSNVAGKPNAVVTFAKSLVQPLLWQNLLISATLDTKEVDIWDISNIL